MIQIISNKLRIENFLRRIELQIYIQEQCLICCDTIDIIEKFNFVSFLTAIQGS